MNINGKEGVTGAMDAVSEQKEQNQPRKKFRLLHVLWHI